MTQINSTYYTTRMKAGADLIQTLSSSLYKNAYYVLDELISNSYDADATMTNIHISQNKITIQDDGEGMDREGLENYLWLGYTIKQQDRKTGKFGRVTIGKFGIGKLSMHVICNKCEIKTTKDGITRTLTLDFNRILSHKGLEEAEIRIFENPANREDVGTLVSLIDLKKTIDVNRAIRRVARNMPLSPDFQVTINNQILKPEEIIRGKQYDIDLNLSLTGKVSGKLIHSDSPLGEFAGIYIKVYGRTVNADDPDIFDLYSSIARPGTFLARLYCVLSADGLDDIVLATRNGFYEDSPKFTEFRDAVLRKIREITRDIQSSQSQEELQYERNLLENVVRHQVQNLLKGAELPDDWLAKYSKRPDAETARGVIHKVRQSESQRERAEKESSRQSRSSQAENTRIIRIGRKRFMFELMPMGKESYECLLDPDKAVFYVNTDHPHYLFSRGEGSLAHHFRRVIVFEIARSISGNSAAELVNQYENMMHQNIEIKQS